MASLCIIDTLGVFAEPSSSGIVNWSKINFSRLETNGRLSDATQQRICERFEQFAASVAPLGYNAFSFDDLWHLTSYDWYPPDLQRLLADYQVLYGNLFAIAKRHDMAIYVNSDYLSYASPTRSYMNTHHMTPQDMFKMVVNDVLTTFTMIDGIILRIGEHDGNDVTDHFLSKLTVHSPKAANRALKHILPTIEHHHIQLVVRTWTVGAYAIGDLIWNKTTYDTVFKGINSSALVVSMKFGDTDFMRYLTLNPLFFRGPHQKILELQTRREWEGMGMLPSFVGWDYEKYIRSLTQKGSIMGISVWCQTGGWAKSEWNNVTYLENSSFWNELNTYVTARLFITGETTEQAVTSFCSAYGIRDVASFLSLLRYAEIAINDGLYIREFASKKYYFRRSRVPTLFWITWDKLLFQPTALWLLRTTIRHPERAVAAADAAVKAAAAMLPLGEHLALPASAQRSLAFQHDTLVVFARLKAYLLLGHGSRAKLARAAHTYHATYPQHYTIPPIPKYGRIRSRRLADYSLRLILRSLSVYRKRDRVLLATSPLQRRVVARYMSKTNSDLKDQSMGIETLFR